MNKESEEYFNGDKKAIVGKIAEEVSRLKGKPYRKDPFGNIIIIGKQREDKDEFSLRKININRGGNNAVLSTETSVYIANGNDILKIISPRFNFHITPFGSLKVKKNGMEFHDVDILDLINLLNNLKRSSELKPYEFMRPYILDEDYIS